MICLACKRSGVRLPTSPPNKILAAVRRVFLRLVDQEFEPPRRPQYLCPLGIAVFLRSHRCVRLQGSALRKTLIITRKEPPPNCFQQRPHRKLNREGRRPGDASHTDVAKRNFWQLTMKAAKCNDRRFSKPEATAKCDTLIKIPARPGARVDFVLYILQRPSVWSELEIGDKSDPLSA